MAQPVAQTSAVPICVDLDGTLIRADMAFETLLAVLRRKPWLALAMPFWLLRGRAAFKDRLAAGADFDPAALPYNEPLLAWLREQRSQGQHLVLATASNRRVAERIAEYLGLFDEVLASDATRNLKGEEKRRRLTERFGSKGFDYVGNSDADVAVWSEARSAVLVNVPPQVAKRAEEVTRVVRTFESARPRTLFLETLRVQQWAKNLLVFVPLIASHLILEPQVFRAGLLMFAAFCLCASSAYVVNDLVDLAADRAHPEKRRRPFASGTLPVAYGLLLAPALAAGGLSIALFLGRPLAMAVLVLYFLVTLGYSFFLKRQPLLDVFTLSGLYTLRIIAGHEATGIVYSPWLLSFSMFLFLSLALNKRVSELGGLRLRGATEAAGRGYRAGDRDQLNVFGVVSGFLACLVLALYINSAAVVPLYNRPLLLWLLCPLMLYWICRIWILAHRGLMGEDPIAFAVRDPVTYLIGAAGGAILIFAAK